MTAAVFSLTFTGEPRTSLSLGEREVIGGEPLVVRELQPCGFQVEGREAGLEYRLWIGDRDPQSSEGGGAKPAAFGRQVLWGDAAHFDGARGRVWVRLASRPAGAGGLWQDRALLPIYVVPSKLSEARYEGMVAELRSLAAGLVFDLVSKSLRAMGLGRGAISARSSQVEIRLIERLWGRLAPALQEIAADPVTRLRASRELRHAWGGERLGARAVARLAAAGLDPRRPGAPRPFPVLHERSVKSTDTTEHRALLGMLRFLAGRVAECARNVRRHIDGIEAERPLRQQAPGGRLTLYETEDLPRLERLRDELARAERLHQRLRQAQRLEPLRGLQPLEHLPNTPVFEHVVAYHRARHEFRRYLHSGLVTLDEGAGERMKSTSRMYEQWVFFQLAAAFRQCGLRCTSREGLFHRTQRYRFNLDVDRGARLEFHADDGRAVVVRFEPWILPREAARERRESLYRGTRGESAWSPDVVIEFLRGGETADAGEAAGVEYAVVVDAKYTGRIREHHWEDTAKYLEIRATRSGRQVVRQLWLAFPDEAIGLSPGDSAISWTPRGPDCPREETFLGILGLLPPEVAAEPAEHEAGWIAEPCANAVAFVSGLLAYLEVPYQPAPPTSGRGAAD